MALQKVNLQHTLGNGETEGKRTGWEKTTSVVQAQGNRALTSDFNSGNGEGKRQMFAEEELTSLGTWLDVTINIIK